MKRSIAFALAVLMLLTAFSVLPASAASTKTLASLVYTGGVAKTDVEGDKNAGYAFTSTLSGVNAKLFASVSGEDNRKLEWTNDVYAYNDGEAVVPCMTGGNKNPWGDAPYFLITLSTSGYSDISFSAKLGGSKKGPADYKLQYSTNGRDFRDVYGAKYSIGDNKVMFSAFDAVSIPELNDTATAYIRIIASSDNCIDSANPAFPGTTGGETAINDIVITGTPLFDEGVDAPRISVVDGATLYTDDTVAVTDLNGAGAAVEVTLSAGGKTLTVDASAPFAPFELLPDGTEQVTVTAETTVDGKTSAPTTATYNWGGDRLADISATTQFANTNGKINAGGGVYGAISSLSASANGKDAFIPLYDPDFGFAISPDDGVFWGKGYWLIETSTAGYSALTLSAKLSSTNKGPASFDLQYSTDGVRFTTLESKRALDGSGALTYYDLPEAACDQATLYLRFLFAEDARLDGAPLYNNESLGNTYLNHLTLAGKQSGDAMPYTTAGDFVAAGESITLISPDNAPITYTVTDNTGAVVIDKATYTAPFTLTADAKQYTLTARCGDSPIFTKKIKVSEAVLAAFDYTADNLDSTSAEMSATSGEGTLAMYPNGTDALIPVYDKDYGVKISASAENTWSFSGSVGDPNGSGYWLMTFSTKGYNDITLSATTTSSAKGPRDFALAYSLDGKQYTAIPASAIRNTDVLHETYVNFTLPAALADQETVYLKFYINGGETTEGKEFAETLGSGHTGINNIAISGRKVREGEVDAIPGDVDYSGVVDVADIMKLKTLIMTGQWTGEELTAGDLNTGGNLDVGDIMGIKSIIMGV